MRKTAFHIPLPLVAAMLIVALGRAAVAQGVGDGEAISRAFTVDNQLPPPPPQAEAISRAFTILNQGPSLFTPTEAISRAFTVINLLPEPPASKDAISRAFTVLNIGTPICGDGLITGVEECDDGNAVDGDGCSSSCTVEDQFVCAGEPSVCLPDCNRNEIDDETDLVNCAGSAWCADCNGNDILDECDLGIAPPEFILETAPQGSTNGGTPISSCTFLGARFSFDRPHRITNIGGHVKGHSSEDRNIFVAIVPVSGTDGFPSDPTLSEAVFTAVIDAPFNDVGPYPYQVADTVINTDFLLDPGTYAIVFGSGLFGATGSGWMPVSGPIQDLPWFFFRNCFVQEDFRNTDEQPIRFLVKGMPAVSTDCNADGIPDECELVGNDCNGNSVPDACDIASETSRDCNADGVPDECAPITAPIADVGGLSKCRTFGIVPGNAGRRIGLRVSLVSLHHVMPPYTGGPSIPFTSFEGQIRWVGPPRPYVESTANPTQFFASPLQCEPYYRDWNAIDVVHVYGSEVVPSSMYDVQAVSEECSPLDEANYTNPLRMQTTRWGDIDIPYNPPSPTTQPDLADISAMVNKFRSIPGAPIKAQAVLAGSVPDFGPDIGFDHISACVDAFRGLPYPYTIASCP